MSDAIRRHVWGPKTKAVQTCPQCGMVRRWQRQENGYNNWFYYPTMRSKKPYPQPVVMDQWPADACTGDRIKEATE